MKNATIAIYKKNIKHLLLGTSALLLSLLPSTQLHSQSCKNSTYRDNLFTGPGYVGTVGSPSIECSGDFDLSNTADVIGTYLDDNFFTPIPIFLAGETITITDVAGNLKNAPNQQGQIVEFLKPSLSVIIGDYLTKGLNVTAGDDLITITNSFVGGIVGDRFYQVKDAIAGDDVIFADNSIISSVEPGIPAHIQGDSFSLVGTGEAGDDIISLNNIFDLFGNVYGDATYGTDSKLDTNSTNIVGGNNEITLTGITNVLGFVYGGTGSDVVNLYDKVTVKGGNIDPLHGDINDVTNGKAISGGDDASTLDGSEDTLNFFGMDLTPSETDPTNSYINFEHVNLQEGTTLTLNEGSSLSPSVTFSIDPSSELLLESTGSAQHELPSNLINNGLVSLSNDANGQAGDVLTISGNGIEANGDLLGTGIFKLDTNFDLAAPATDKIVVQGDLIAQGTIQINDVTTQTHDPFSNTTQGTQEATTASSVELVVIEAPNDTNKDDDKFILETSQRYNGETNKGRFDGSPFVWELKPSGNNWVLGYGLDPRPENQPTEVPPTTPDRGEDDDNDPQTLEVLAEIPAYVSLPSIGRILAFSEMESLHTRLGELRRGTPGLNTGSATLSSHNAFSNLEDGGTYTWIRGHLGGIDVTSDSSFDFDGTYGGVDFGMDSKISFQNGLTAFTGVFGGYRHGDFGTSGKSGHNLIATLKSDIDISSWTAGGYATFFQGASYLDLVGSVSMLEADIKAANLSTSNKGSIYALSAEVGHSINLNSKLLIEPQAQLKYAHVNWQDFNDGFSDINFEGSDFLTARLGARLEQTFATEAGEFKPWGSLSVLHEFADGSNVDYGNTRFESHDFGTVGELKLGMTYKTKKAVQLYGNLKYTTDFDETKGYGADLGIRINW